MHRQRTDLFSHFALGEGLFHKLRLAENPRPLVSRTFHPTKTANNVGPATKAWRGKAMLCHARGLVRIMKVS
jgi:hypothetical protein